MSEALLNLIRREVERVIRNIAHPRVAIVDGVDMSGPRYAARVLLLPEQKLTGWLPVLTDWMGNGWGSMAPLSPGDQVAVIFQEHDKDSGIILGRLYDSRNAAPEGVGATERWLLHRSGSFIKLLDDGKLSLNGNVEIDATAPTIKITATIEVDVSAPTINATATTVANVVAPEINLGSSGETLHTLALGDALATLFNSHTHSDPQGGNTGVPNQTMGAAQETSVVKAG